MTSSLDLLDLTHAAIVQAGTDAQGDVFRPGDWPTQDGQYPIIKLRLIGEDRQSASRSGPTDFTTVTTIRIVGEVSEPARLDDAGATEAEARLWALKRQIDVAVINSYPLASAIQRVLSMRSQLAFNADSATHLAGIQTDLALEFYEGPEQFAPVDTSDLHEVDLAVSGYQPTGFLALQERS